ncbi:unnamed protein product [Rotaria sordida]|uniref:Uncharacterized protein n=1 Tax=Rotaria sordida TaxID=392033 RepID=A0A814XP44_9BILA|nr:unnamed protein product [Rotaria sordida]
MKFTIYLLIISPNKYYYSTISDHNNLSHVCISLTDDYQYCPKRSSSNFFFHTNFSSQNTIYLNFLLRKKKNYQE